MNTVVKIDERPIVVLGATAGWATLFHQLLAKGISIRAVARNTTKLKDLADKGAEIWTGAIEEQDFMNAVFTNSKTAFILTPGDTVLDPTT